MPNLQNIEKWVKALRSGRYKQARETLHHEESNGYCCLGVLCKISKLGKFEDHEFILNPRNGGCEYGTSAFPPKEVADWVGLEKLTYVDFNPKVIYKGKPTELSVLNDDKHLSFKQIADLIEAQYLKKPTKVTKKQTSVGKTSRIKNVKTTTKPSK